MAVLGSGVAARQVDWSGALDSEAQSDVRSAIQAPRVLTSEVAAASTLAATAYAAGASVLLKPGETSSLTLDAADFMAQGRWLASQQVADSASLAMTLPAGLTEVNGYLDVSGRRALFLQGPALPDILQISGVAITSLGSNQYSAVITVTTALPAVVVVGYPVGCQNCKGTDAGVLNAMDAINGAHKVTSIAEDRLSFGITFRSYGVALSSPSSLDNTTTYGLAANKVIVPKAALKLNSAGWDGAAREGFINAFKGALVNLKWLGLAYDGIADEHDILFAKDIGSHIVCEDYVVIAGAGDKILRASYGGFISAVRSCFGGGVTAGELFQGFKATADFVRCSIGSFSANFVSDTADTGAVFNQCVLTGAPNGLYASYPDSTMTMVTSRLRFCDTAHRAVHGEIYSGTNYDIGGCTNIYNVSSSNAGRYANALGFPTLTDNTNAAASVADRNEGFRVAIGAAEPTATRVVDVEDFGSIAAHSYVEVGPVTWTGLVSTDILFLSPQSGPPAQNLMFSAYVVSAGDAYMMRVANLSASSIDPANRTYFVTVLRTKL